MLLLYFEDKFWLILYMLNFKITSLVFLFSILIFNPSWGAELLLFDNKKFLGCMNCDEYESGSICNSYGNFGSEYNSDSIWNEYGTYGSEYSSNSPWNEYSSSAPKIVDRQGNYYGRFSINIYSGYSQSSDLAEIYNSVDGDLDKVRDIFCK